MARHADGHGVGIDEFTVREEKGEEEKKGAMGPRGRIVSPFTSAGTQVELAGR